MHSLYKSRTVFRPPLVAVATINLLPHSQTTPPPPLTTALQGGINPSPTHRLLHTLPSQLHCRVVSTPSPPPLTDYYTHSPHNCTAGCYQPPPLPHSQTTTHTPLTTALQGVINPLPSPTHRLLPPSPHNCTAGWYQPLPHSQTTPPLPSQLHCRVVSTPPPLTDYSPPPLTTALQGGINPSPTHRLLPPSPHNCTAGWYQPLPHSQTTPPLPSQLHCRVVELWKEDLAKTNAKAAQSLADPMQYENLFPELKQALQAEEALKSERQNLQPAASFTSRPVSKWVASPLDR